MSNFDHCFRRPLRAQKVVVEETGEVELYGHSEPRQKKEQAIQDSFSEKYEDALWRTYTLLTDLEGVFRSLKSELGLRPIYHQKEERVSAHIFITLLAVTLWLKPF